MRRSCGAGWEGWGGYRASEAGEANVPIHIICFAVMSTLPISQTSIKSMAYLGEDQS